ncbi:SDR family NAD(P)-dependent oxidoreductase [Micromonospora sp. Llam0]|uniref:SDR family NAD(P)-dependent oxidoreductase n=1 Tax=Micromonospora sp. Llam0 TaxID=2485143 RepID=UPI0013155836|nr:SDR family oxidoreductase [Micromonospora sp. Llam0]
MTAAGGGIGAAVAAGLEDEGAQVWRLDRRPCTDRGFISCDVSSDAEVASAREIIIAETPTIHHLYNGVGMLPPRLGLRLEEEDVKEWQTVFDTNLHSMVRVLGAFATSLSEDGSSSVVNMSSDQSLVPRGDALAYAASKAAVNAFTIGLARQWIPRRIRVNAIAPGAVRSGFIDAVAKTAERRESMFAHAEATLPLGLGQPEAAAELVRFLLSADARNITGELFRADSGQALMGIRL